MELKDEGNSCMTHMHPCLLSISVESPHATSHYALLVCSGKLIENQSETLRISGVD
jgi:hypothetical protein